MICGNRFLWALLISRIIGGSRRAVSLDCGCPPATSIIANESLTTPCPSAAPRATIERKFDANIEVPHAGMRDARLRASNSSEQDSSGVRTYFASPMQPTVSDPPTTQRYVISPLWPTPPCQVDTIVRPIIAATARK